MQFATMGQRAWWAWQCLPRDERGNPPEWRVLERDHGLSNATLYKVVWDIAVRPSWEVLSRVGAALQCSPEWLQTGRGQQPLASYPIPARPSPPQGARKRRTKSGQLRKVSGKPED